MLTEAEKEQFRKSAHYVIWCQKERMYVGMGGGRVVKTKYAQKFTRKAALDFINSQGGPGDFLIEDGGLIPITNEALIDEVSGFVEDEGYQVIDTLITDHHRTVKLVVEKNGKKSVLPIIECFYDTDSEGNRTKFQGVLDIRRTRWYKKLWLWTRLCPIA